MLFAIKKADETKAVIMYVSGAVALTLFLVVLCYHVFTELCVPLYRRLKQRSDGHNDRYKLIETEEVDRKNAESAEPTFTVIDGQPLASIVSQ